MQFSVVENIKTVLGRNKNGTAIVCDLDYFPLITTAMNEANENRAAIISTNHFLEIGHPIHRTIILYKVPESVVSLVKNRFSLEAVMIYHVPPTPMYEG